jgi:dipeptidyl aminopeptidase/acylaminoacyl peptidase
LKKYHFKQFSATRLFYPVVRYSPDGKLIGHITNTTGQYNLWTIPSGGGFAQQLTSYSDNTVRDFAWSPDGQQLALQIDQNGDEFHQMYLLPARGGWAQAITNAMQAQHYVACWSPDGKTLLYTANDRKPTDMDVILHNVATGETQRPYPQDKRLYAISWSPDGRYVLAMDVFGNTNQDVLMLNVETGEVVNTTPHEGDGVFQPAVWANDSSGFYLMTSYQREFLGLAFYSLANKKWEFLETPDHDVENVVLSKNDVLVWSVNENGASKLRGRDLKTGKELTMPDLPLCVIGGMDINHEGTRLAITLARPTEAFNLYEVDLASGQIQALSQSMLGGVDPADMVEPEAVFYPTFDGRQVPAWLYRPKGEGKFPIVLSIHGGPEAQERTQYNYNGLYQYLLNRGFGVLAPNIRGSTGYGLSYQKLIHRDWGGGELKDIEHAAKYLRTLDWVDSNRIAVFGGSFGGFASLSAITRLPEYWACAIDVVGPSNLITFVNSVPPHWRAFMKEWVGDAEEDRDMLIERSPITYVDKIRVPLLVIQGAKDPRVVQAESDQMVERIRKNGGSVEYYVDENEGHGATRRENAIKWFQMIGEYLENQLLDEPV